MAAAHIESERLTLRDFRPDDFEAFFATSRDPEYQRFYSAREVSRAFWREIFTGIVVAADAPERTVYQLAVCLRDGPLIGTCGVRIEDTVHRQASFGCAIAREHWGRGLALEGGRSVIEFGFTSLPVHRLYAETISENTAARRLAERLGMRLEGELRQNRFFDGRWWDTAVYAILEEEWRAGRASDER